jgi:hypothetical protein
LAAAERAYQLGLALTQAAQEQETSDEIYRELVGISATIGAWSEGEAAYSALQASPEEATKAWSFAFIHAARLRWGEGRDPSYLLGEGLRRARENRFLRAEREVQRLIGDVAFVRGDLIQAYEAWQAAYAIAQREGIPLGPFLANLARVHATQQDGDQARATLTEALALGGKHVALAAVEVYTALGEQAEARRYVDAAYREAWADGPPYAFYHELGRIRAALKTLGLPEPQLPPFDPARVPPLPDEDEIRAFIEELKRKQNQGADEDEDNGVTPVQPNGKRPWWKFWSQN